MERHTGIKREQERHLLPYWGSITVVPANLRPDDQIVSHTCAPIITCGRTLVKEEHRLAYRSRTVTTASEKWQTTDRRLEIRVPRLSSTLPGLMLSRIALKYYTFSPPTRVLWVWGGRPGTMVLERCHVGPCNDAAGSSILDHNTRVCSVVRQLRITLATSYHPDTARLFPGADAPIVLRHATTSAGCATPGCTTSAGAFEHPADVAF